MIIESLINGAFSLVEWIITLIPAVPDISSVSSWLSGIIPLINAAGAFVPLDAFVFCIGNILAWMAINFVISLVRFVLDFIPIF